MFSVRFHGRSGQGVVTAAELLAADRPIRTHEPVTEPDALVVQDPTLLARWPWPTSAGMCEAVYYCKGCGICAAECPCGAIDVQPEPE